MKDFCSPLIPLVALGLLVLTGCSPKNVEMLLLDGPERLETNESGAFNATVNEDAKPPVLYEWTFGDGTTAEGATTTHAFPEAGSYTYTVTASNRNGKASVTEAGSVMIVDPPVPAQILAVLASTVDTDTQTPVQFSANVRGDAPLSYTWAFGDGASSSSPRPSIPGSTSSISWRPRSSPPASWIACSPPGTSRGWRRVAAFPMR